MTYEVQFQVGTAEYTVRGPDIDGVLRLIQGVQGAEVVPEHEDRRDAAETTLKGLNYEWLGGALWAPPIGKAPDHTGWVNWVGGGCPVPSGVVVAVQLRGEIQMRGEGQTFTWQHYDLSTDIVRYRVCE